jgi:hypothetical protein
MSIFGDAAGISKKKRANPVPLISTLLVELRSNGLCISPKEESNILTNFLSWMSVNKKNGIPITRSEKKKKFHDIVTAILNFSRSQGIFDDLSDLEKTHENFVENSSNLECDIPEPAGFEWMVEKTPKKVQFQLPTSLPDSFPEPSLSRTLRRIFVTDLIIQNYVYGPYKNLFYKEFIKNQGQIY